MRFGDGGCEGDLWIELLDFEKAPLSKILNPTKVWRRLYQQEVDRSG